jgi:hypothetical protein
MHNFAYVLGSRAQKDASIEDCQCSRKIGDWASQCWLLQRKEKNCGGTQWTNYLKEQFIHHLHTMHNSCPCQLGIEIRIRQWGLCSTYAPSWPSLRKTWVGGWDGSQLWSGDGSQRPSLCRIRFAKVLLLWRGGVSGIVSSTMGQTTSLQTSRWNYKIFCTSILN